MVCEICFRFGLLTWDERSSLIVIVFEKLIGHLLFLYIKTKVGCNKVVVLRKVMGMARRSFSKVVETFIRYFLGCLMIKPLKLVKLFLPNNLNSLKILNNETSSLYRPSFLSA